MICGVWSQVRCLVAVSECLCALCLVLPKPANYMEEWHMRGTGKILPKRKKVALRSCRDYKPKAKKTAAVEVAHPGQSYNPDIASHMVGEVGVL